MRLPLLLCLLTGLFVSADEWLQPRVIADTTRQSDWQGWRQLDWDLGKLPPRNVDGSSIDTPPLELVLEVTFDVPPAGRHLHFYVDDLTLD